MDHMNVNEPLECRIPLSSGHLSVDEQTDAVVSYLCLSDRWSYQELRKDFPEYSDARIVWSGSWVDTEASRVPEEYMDWLRDWIETNTPVEWEDGEPWLVKETIVREA
jgi:hypothetical protein